MIYICIPVFDRPDRTRACLESIFQQGYRDFRVVMCDHSPSGDIGAGLQQEFNEIVILRGDPSMWWTAATNRCVEYALEQGAPGDYVFTLNNDTVLEKNCLEVLINSVTDDPKLIPGCVNLLRTEGEARIEPSAQLKVSFAGFLRYRNADTMGDPLNGRSDMRPVDTLSGKGVLIPMAVFEQIGLYNEKMLPHYHADTEFSVRAARYGYRLRLHYGARLWSWHEETGINARNSSTGIGPFLKGFGSVKSTRHLPTLINLNRLLHGWKFPFYLALNLAGITAGFLRRYFRS